MLRCSDDRCSISPLAGYSGTPLVKKLGIKPGTTLALVGAPADFGRALAGLPDDVRIVTRMIGAPDLAIWFVASRRGLDGRIAAVAAATGGGLWIAWPKQTSPLAADVKESHVRAAGLAHGLVDYKICAIDETWSGLKFARRAAPRRARTSR
jgi:hypothetical protein